MHLVSLFFAIYKPLHSPLLDKLSDEEGCIENFGCGNKKGFFLYYIIFFKKSQMRDSKLATDVGAYELRR